MIKILKLVFISGKYNFEFICIDLNTIVIENTCHLSNSPIRMFRNYTFCVHMHNLHTGANLHHLERRGKFLNTVHMAKHLHPRSNCAHERGFSLIKSHTPSTLIVYFLGTHAHTCTTHNISFNCICASAEAQMSLCIHESTLSLLAGHIWKLHDPSHAMSAQQILISLLET